MVSYISYRDHTVDLSLSAGDELDLGDIVLIPEDAQLDEVIVEGERSYMEMNFDSRSFKVGKDITSLGGNALDVLDNVPSITADFEGNVSLRGNGGVRFKVSAMIRRIFIVKPMR